jgi:translation initiation factor 2 beta subunit (eIF-2beta)/eIF-5
MNANEYLLLLNRSNEHFLIFLNNEFPTRKINWYSENINDGIIIHGKYLKKKDICDLILKYINTYVICASCNSPYTNLTKNNKKNYIFFCNTCNTSKITQ